MTELPKVLPHSIVAEEALLGSVLNKESNYNIATRNITGANVFYVGMHQRIWRIMNRLNSMDRSIDAVSVCSMITANDRKKYPDLNSFYVTGLLDHGIQSKVDSYSQIVLEKYLQRQLIRETEDIKNFCLDNNKQYEDIVNKVSSVTNSLQRMRTGKEFSLSKLIKETSEAIKNPVDLIKYGYDSLNHLAGGMTRGEISVIAGRPGHGKTTFCINLVHKLLQQGYKVLVFNREMSNSEMLKKLLVVSNTSLSHSKIRKGNIDASVQKEIDRSFVELEELFKKQLIMFDDVFDLAGSSAIIEKFRPDVVIDDHIQLIKANTKLEGRRFEIESIMQEYKMLSKKHKMVSILVSQLNRNIEQRVDPIPKLSDLAESGSIEQLAENIIFIYYDYKVRFEDSEFGPNKNQIIAAKVRYGTSGRLTMGFDGDKCLFYETSYNGDPIRDKEIHIPKQATIEDTKDLFQKLALTKV